MAPLGSAGNSSTSPFLLATEQTSEFPQSFEETPEVTSPANWTAPTLMAPLDTPMEDHHIRPYVPPNFEEAFLTCKSFQDESHELEIWLKGQNGKISFCESSASWICCECSIKAAIQTKKQGERTG